MSQTVSIDGATAAAPSERKPRRKNRINKGLRKLCPCKRASWPKCSHPWHFNFKAPGQPAIRFSIDIEAGEHIESKTEAEALAEAWRTQIRDGTFKRRVDREREDAEALARTNGQPVLTFAGFLRDIYFERRGKAATAAEKSHVNQIEKFEVPAQGKLGDFAIETLTEDVLEQFFVHLKGTYAASTCNKYVQLVKHSLRWATRKGYLPRNPITEDAAITRSTVAKRHRRLVPDQLDEKGNVKVAGEERQLMAVASPMLQRLIVAALETCCRRGELLALQWKDVDVTKRKLRVRAEIAKTRTERVLPISARLLAILAFAKGAFEATLPATLTAQEKAKVVAEGYVFGDKGLPAGDIKRAWTTCVLKAHGHQPAWTRNAGLAPESQAALDAIDLHFHDLRHEAGSRLLEAGWPLHHVQHMLGHANLSQTSTYLNATQYGLEASMTQLEALRCNPVANTPLTEALPVCNEPPAVTENIFVN